MPNGKNAISRYILNGTQINAPVEWATIEALATFDKDAIQANITIDKFTFVNAEATALINHINSGMTGGVGITEALPFVIELYNNINQQSIFNGMVDLSDGVEINEFSNKVTAKLRLRDELYTLEEKLQSLSFGYLESSGIGLFTNSDYTNIQYVVQKKVNIIESIVMGIVLYIMTKELIDTIVRINKDIGAIIAYAATGVIGGALAAIIFSIVVTTLEILYAALLLVAILKMLSTLISQLVPVRRRAKGLLFKTALTKICSHLGYSFSSNITDLNSVYYLPSNFNFDSTTSLGIIDQWKGNTKGIPASSDYGYNCADFFEIARKLFNGKYAIINGTVVFNNTDDLSWNQYSSFHIPNVRNKIKTYNTDELVANRYFAFDVDYSDEWTIEDYTGNSYEVITNQQITNDIKLKNIRRLEEIRFGICLGSRKNETPGIENFLTNVAAMADGIITTLGGIAMFVQMVGSSIGLMKISTNNWTKPKVLKLDSNQRLVARSLWSAKYINDNFYIGKSFVATVNGLQNYGQKEVYRNVKIPFGMNDFVSMLNNSYAYLPDGTPCKITSCKYRFSADTAIVDYFIRKPYTANLVETYIEPTNQ